MEKVNKDKFIHVRCTPQLMKRVKLVAIEKDYTISYMVGKALDEYLEIQELRLNKNKRKKKLQEVSDV